MNSIYDINIARYLERSGVSTFRPRAALIDMDGTLYDSMPRHARAWQQMMAEIGVDVPLDEFFRYEGRTGKSTINIIFNRVYNRDASEQEVTDLYRRKSELFASMPAVDVMPGAKQMLATFVQAGMKRVLVTGSGQNTLLNRLSADFPGVFSDELRVTSRDVVYGKPAPEPFLKGMEKAGALCNECIVMENAPLGVQSGHAAGAFTIGVTTGPLPAAELEEAGADIVFPSMKECADALPLLLSAMITYPYAQR